MPPYLATIAEEYSLEEFGDPQDMDLRNRTQLYERGQEYLRRGKKTMALKCYLRCLKGLDQANGFQPLPQCLRSVSVWVGVGIGIFVCSQFLIFTG